MTRTHRASYCNIDPLTTYRLMHLLYSNLSLSGWLAEGKLNATPEFVELLTFIDAHHSIGWGLALPDLQNRRGEDKYINKSTQEILELDKRGGNSLGLCIKNILNLPPFLIAHLAMTVTAATVLTHDNNLLVNGLSQGKATSRGSTQAFLYHAFHQPQLTRAEWFCRARGMWSV